LPSPPQEAAGRHHDVVFEWIAELSQTRASGARTQKSERPAEGGGGSLREECCVVWSLRGSLYVFATDFRFRRVAFSETLPI